MTCWQSNVLAFELEIQPGVPAVELAAYFLAALFVQNSWQKAGFSKNEHKTWVNVGDPPHKSHNPTSSHLCQDVMPRCQEGGVLAKGRSQATD